MEQAADEAAAQRHVRNREFVQVLHGAKLLRQPRYADPPAGAGDDIAELAHVGALFDEARGFDFQDQPARQRGPVCQHAFQASEKRSLSKRGKRHRDGQRAFMREQPVQAQANRLDIAFGGQTQAHGGRHEDRGRHGIGAGQVMQRQAGLVLEQRAGQVVQGLGRQREPVLLQRRDQRVVPAVFADAGAVGGLARRGDLVVIGAFGAHERVVQAGQDVAHVVARRECGHGQRPAAPAELVHGHAQRPQFAAHALGQHAGLRRRGARQQQGEIRSADARNQRPGAAEFLHQLAQAIRRGAQPLVGEGARQVAVDLRQVALAEHEQMAAGLIGFVGQRQPELVDEMLAVGQAGDGIPVDLALQRFDAGILFLDRGGDAALRIDKRLVHARHFA